MQLRFAALLAALVILGGSCHDEEELLTDEFALELQPWSNRSVAEEIAGKHGFELLYHVHALGNVFHLRHRAACKQQQRHSQEECRQQAASLRASAAQHPQFLSLVHLQQEQVERRETGMQPGDGGLLQEAEEDLQLRAKGSAHYHELDLALTERKQLQPKFNDPQFHNQWHLHNSGQMKGINPGLDLNVLPAWSRGYTGAGVVVTVVDDGVDVSNPDLRRTDLLASADLNNLTNPLGTPIRAGKLDYKVSHGTACAGEIGATANNKFCGVGVAYAAKVGGIRILDGTVTDLLEAHALLHNNQYISIYSCSWGPKDNGWKMDMPKFYTARALQLSARFGRGGLGSLVVMASGNGGTNGDNCGADGFVNSPFTIAAAAVNIYGQSPLYAESCSAIHVAAPVGGYDSMSAVRSHAPDPRITTTAVNGGCTSRMCGTSAATPLVAGCLALALQANPKLSWRDVQHLLAHSARLPSARGGGWQRNGAGILVSHQFGFGLLDCSLLVTRAQTWTPVAKQVGCFLENSFSGRRSVPLGRASVFHFKSTSCQGQLHRVEHAQVFVRMRLQRRGDAELWLLSPSGTKSQLLAPRPRDNDIRLGITQWFLSLQHWDELPTGRWTVLVRERRLRKGGRMRPASGVVLRVAVKLLGRAAPGAAAAGSGSSSGSSSRRLRAGRGYWLKADELTHVFQHQQLAAARRRVLHPDLAQLIDKLPAAAAAADDDDDGDDAAAAAASQGQQESQIAELRRLLTAAKAAISNSRAAAAAAAAAPAAAAATVSDDELRFLLRRVESLLRRRRRK